MKTVFGFIAILLLLCFCKNSLIKPSCHFNLNQLLVLDTPKIAISYINDTLTEARDSTIDNSGGVYTFDRNKNLRFYAFMIDSTRYQYSEEYDIDGNIMKKEGKPLVVYQLHKENHDTISFVFSLFSLNKKYDDIEVISSRGDTIEPEYLYRSKLYSNVKCFYFKLPVAKDIDSLVLYARIKLTNTCNQENESFSDTISFKNIKL